MTMTPTPTLDLAADASEPLTGRDARTGRHHELRARLAGSTSATDAAATTLLVKGFPAAPPHTSGWTGYQVSSAGFVFDLSDIDTIETRWRDGYAEFLDRLFTAASGTRGHRTTVTLLHPPQSTD